ncbi:MAG: hypothetical protein QOK43_2595 [Acidimicrobiaceae bacterium]|nr:hypothetical protein [Acidimicrobiaceae bacterium]
MKRLALMVAAAVIVLGACGGGSSSGGSGAGGSGSGGAQGTAPKTVVVKGYKFAPRTLTVQAGGKVTFKFDDGQVAHNAVAKDKSFDTGTKTQEDAVITLDQVGKFPYTCTLHPTMKGTIVVE